MTASCRTGDAVSRLCEHKSSRVLVLVRRILEKEGYTIKLESGKIKVSLMLVLKKKTAVRKFNTKGWDISARRDYRCWKSRAVWQEKSRFKHEAFGKFKEWKQLVENQTGRTVKKLRTDNVLEFCNRDFEQLCIESGIARHLTVVGTPQQNGVAKRMNKTLMDKVRCLLIQSGLPKTFWAEATCMAAYLINRSPSRTIEKKTLATNIAQKDKKQSKTDKTKHRNGKSARNRSRR
ncbi:retrovirus-related pol polyprotein from transposon TNT 1-94 [Tanacetum coccineum]